MSKGISAADVRLKRAYQPPARDDGLRILIDRLWPRGVTKKSAAIDEWFKDVAPSTELRQWFGHDPSRWQEFRRRYAGELRQNPEHLGKLRECARQGPITLVFSAHDEAHNDAVVLCLTRPAVGKDHKVKRRRPGQCSNAVVRGGTSIAFGHRGDVKVHGLWTWASLAAAHI